MTILMISNCYSIIYVIWENLIFSKYSDLKKLNSIGRKTCLNIGVFLCIKSAPQSEKTWLFGMRVTAAQTSHTKFQYSNKSL